MQQALPAFWLTAESVTLVPAGAFTSQLTFLHTGLVSALPGPKNMYPALTVP